MAASIGNRNKLVYSLPTECQTDLFDQIINKHVPHSDIPASLTLNNTSDIQASNIELIINGIISI